MEWLNILSKEEVTRFNIIPFTIVSILCILAIIIIMIHLIVKQDDSKTYKYLCYTCPICFISIFVTILLSGIFAQESTGEYKYSATIDKDKITVAEYEEFIQSHNVTVVDGVYYWQE